MRSRWRLGQLLRRSYKSNRIALRSFMRRCSALRDFVAARREGYGARSRSTRRLSYLWADIKHRNTI